MSERSHYGIARYIYEGNAAEARRHSGRGKQVLQRLLARMENDGVTVGAEQLRVDDRTYIYARVLRNINVVRIVSGYGEAVEKQPVKQGVPDFYNGVTVKGYITEDVTGTFAVLDSFIPNGFTQAVHGLEAGTRIKPRRLAVQPHENVRELDQVPPFSPLDLSQYTRLKPTLYSGKMQKVVQALLGFGIPQDESVYDHALTELLEPDQAREFVRAQKASPYERSVSSVGRQVRYDYKWHRTHGIVTAEDNRLWLVEISITRGVVAMMLPLHDLTTQPEFLDYLHKLPVQNEGEDEPHEVEDEAAIRIVEELGGFPTGQGFPESTEEFDALKRAGYIVELAKPETLNEFYACSAYSSMLGWAFSQSGDEAHNTAWRYGDDGYQEGLHYQMNISIAAFEPPEPVTGAKALKGLLDELAQDYPKRIEAAKLKVDRLSKFDVGRYLRRIGSGSAKEVFNEIDRKILDPVVTATASPTIAAQGKLYNPGLTPYYQIKFYQYELGFCLSHDFRPTTDAIGVPEPACDTTMHVFFAGEELKYVKYWRDSRNTASHEVDSDFEDCMYVGAWTKTETSGGRSVGRAFYTNDYDDRRELAEYRQVTKIKSEDFGYARAIYRDHIDDFRISDLLRFKRFRERAETVTTSGNAIYSAVAIPGGDRNSYYYATMEYFSRKDRYLNWRYKELQDPHFAQGWRCVISTAGFAIIPEEVEECGIYCPVAINYPGYRPGETGLGDIGGSEFRYARFIYYDRYPCSDFADEGPWIQKCDIFERKAFNQPAPPLPANEHELEKQTGRLQVFLAIDRDPFLIKVRDDTYKNAAYRLPKWFVPSPDQLGLTQSIYETHNTLGKSNSTVYDTNLNAQKDEQEKYGKPDYDGMTPSGTNYIGVVDA